MNVTNVNNAPTPALALVAAKPKKELRRGRIKSPFRILLHGMEKSGKSTFAMGAPQPLWLGREHGTEHLSIDRLPVPETLRAALETIDEVARGEWDDAVGAKVQTLVVDPIGWFEPLMHLAVTGDLSIPLASWGGGFGKGFSAALDQWRLFLKALERAWLAGLNIIIIAHTETKSFDDPEGANYKRYELALENQKAAGLLKQWVDHILFAKREAFGKTDAASKKTKAYGSAARMLYTEWTPAYDAGNRAMLPPELPLSWSAFAEALANGIDQIEKLRKQIDEGLAELGDADVEKKVRAWLTEPNVNVAAVANAVAAKLGEKRAQQVGEATKEG